MPRRSGALRRCTGMGAKPRAPRLAGFGFVMVPYRSLPLGARSCDLRSITPLSQKCAYQRQPASEEPRVLEVARLGLDETACRSGRLAAATPFRAKRGRPVRRDRASFARGWGFEVMGPAGGNGLGSTFAVWATLPRALPCVVARTRALQKATRLSDDPQCYWQLPRRQLPSRAVLVC